MKYYAKTYSASPKHGLITPGEVLSDEQVTELGEEKIADMVRRGLLGTLAEEAEVEEAGSEPDGNAGSVKGDEAEAEDTTGGDEGGEDELPELDAADAIGEEEKPAAKPARKSGRRTGK